MTTDQDQPRATRWRNPYIGPRAFRSGERLPAREQETYELTDLLIAERVVLLHAPSGAGKTSLIQAGVVPLLEQEQLFQQKPFRPTSLLRVKTPPPDRGVRNRYIYSVALDLLPDRDPRELDSMTLPDLIEAATRPSTTEIPVLIVDQFEEILRQRCVVLAPGQADAATSLLDQIAKTSSSNATATRRFAGWSNASS